MIDETIKTLKDVGDYKEINSSDIKRSIVCYDKDKNIICNIDDFQAIIKTGKDNTIKAGTKEEIDKYIEDEKLNIIEVEEIE